jgi:peptidoglycan/LPS O-acetylase OafA/YrhL
MRAAAIALVLFSHTALFFPTSRLLFDIGVLAGYFGVELFFVLSGFLIGGILLRTLNRESSRGTLPNFWWRRWLRTLPNYFLFLFINILVAIWLGRGIPSLLPYLFFWQSFAAPPQPFFVESWSLAVEEWFYILVPILFAIAIKLSRKSFRLNSLLVICGVIAAVTVARSIYVVVAHPDWLRDVRMIVVYRLDACMFGVLGAWLKHYHSTWLRERARILFAVGLSLIAAVAGLPFALPGDSLFLHTTGFTLTSVGALLLLPMFQQWTVARGPAANAVAKISLWSYSLYLVNLPVHAVLTHFFRHSPPLLLAVAFPTMSILLAALLYRLYEKPIMNLRDRRAAPQPNFPLLDAPVLMAKN